MRFERLRDEVVMAERRVETRMLRAQTNWRVLKTVWRESWTPARILAVGLAGGFLFGRARPLKKMGAVSPTRWIQLASSLSGLCVQQRDVLISQDCVQDPRVDQAAALKVNARSMVVTPLIDRHPARGNAATVCWARTMLPVRSTCTGSKNQWAV